MFRLTLSTPPVKSGHISPDSYSLKAVVFYSSLFGFSGHLLFLVLFALMGVYQMAVINIASCMIFLFCLWVVQRGYTHLALLLGAGEVVGHALLAVVFVGWESGFHYYILGLVPLIFYSQNFRTSYKSLLSVTLFFLYFSLYFYTRQALPWIGLQPQLIYIFGGMNIAILFGVFAILSHCYRSSALQAENALKKANQNLECLAQTDPLTSLLNRRSITALIAREIRIYYSTGQPFSIIMSDIDDFKSFNDRFGHEIGDQILVEVAELMRCSARDQDRVSRWGGEEFLVLLPGTDQVGAKEAAERLRKTIAAAQMAAGGGENQITMTFGVATYPGSSGSCEAKDCIHWADMAMYEGKRQGKNCVIMYNP